MAQPYSVTPGALCALSPNKWHIKIPNKLQNHVSSLKKPTFPIAHVRKSSSSSSPSSFARVRKISASFQPLDLTEDNVKLVLFDSRTEFAQIFDTSVGMTGEVELVELDGPYVKISLRGRFWHERSLVLARLGNYLKQRIPEILEVEIEDEKQLDDSPANF